MEEEQEKETVKTIISLSRYLMLMSVLLLCCILLFIISTFIKLTSGGNLPPGISANPLPKPAPIAAIAKGSSPRPVPADAWKAPDNKTIPTGKPGEMIRYGKELIVSTAKYLGPRGTVAHLTNGMNCQNCHLDGGAKLFSNNFAGFIASYPKYSARSGKMVPASERIAECFKRSLNGKVPDTSKKEVQAMLAYMKWIGKEVKTGEKLFGTSTEKLAFLDHPADPAKGKAVFMTKCQRCHGLHGEGILATDKSSYTYPPLWGANSYNDGAGMYRVINFAGFVKNNMPLGATYQNPQLTDEEAWDVAAFVNSQPRPHKNQGGDYPIRSEKPVDMPFGPYADRFSSHQHKLGPFGPIQKAKKVILLKSVTN